MAALDDDSWSLLLTILDSVPDAMIVIDESGSMLGFSRAAEALFGYKAEDIIGQNVSMLMTAMDEPYHDQYIRNYLATGVKQIIGIGRVVKAKHANGDVIPVELKIGETQLEGYRLFTGYLRDLTEKQASDHRLNELQAELANFSRLSAVGTMASAMAHELNQPLTAIANYLEAARDLLNDPKGEGVEIASEAVNAAASQSLRAGQIVRRLRDFVSRGEIDARPADINAIVQEAISLTKAETGRQARLIEQLDGDLPPVLIDRLQIRQVILNLVRNATEALANTANPQIWIQTEAYKTGQILVSVRDNGPGIELADGESPFDAFRSSKASGMGLGLAICQTIVESHGGHIWFSSTDDEKGACFKFSLKHADR